MTSCQVLWRHLEDTPLLISLPTKRCHRSIAAEEEDVWTRIDGRRQNAFAALPMRLAEEGPAALVIEARGVRLAYPDDDEDDDPWDKAPRFPDQEEPDAPWSELSWVRRALRVLVGFFRVVALLLLLLAFACSLDLLGSGFRLACGRGAGLVFRESRLLRSPLVGLMVGVLATVLLQSSSSSTSIVVTMVASGLLRVGEAIPVVMGANIGTSVTNTVVSLGQAGDRDEFRRAFAAATIHDMFNWLAVLVLLPLEAATGYLEALTEAMMSTDFWRRSEEGGQEGSSTSPLQTLTKPITSLFVQLDKQLIEDLATGRSNDSEKSFLRTCPNRTEEHRCGFLLELFGWSDGALGLLLLLLSLVFLCSCLLLLVRLLHSALQGGVARALERLVNFEPASGCGRAAAGWACVLAGALLTALLQSSSVFTSALTPLAGVGLVSLERIYPLTLGANLGTTTTSLLAALASPPGEPLADAMRVSLAHLLFNVHGILLFYPVPATRLPILLARRLGSVTARYRWFAVLYLFAAFLALPGAVFALSAAGGPWAVMGAAIPCAVVGALAGLLNLLQRRRPLWLPLSLRNWSFLPECLRSLAPLDRLLGRCCGACCGGRCWPGGGAPPGTGRGRRGPAPLGSLPNPISQTNILEPCSASASALSLCSSGGGTFESHALNGFENIAFPPPCTPWRNNNNEEVDKHSRRTTAL